MKHVYLAVPSSRGTPCIEMQLSLQRACNEISAMGGDVELHYTVGDGILPRARNLFLTDFWRRKKFTDMLFWDDDVACEAGAIPRLLSHGVELVAGIYPKREHPIKYPWRALEPLNIRPDGLIEALVVPTGLMRISRACAEKMIEYYRPTREFIDDNMDEPAVACFDFELVDRRYWGEDFVFCKRWREIGGRVWADSTLRLAHYGPQAFVGCVADTLTLGAIAQLRAAG